MSSPSSPLFFPMINPSFPLHSISCSILSSYFPANQTARDHDFNARDGFSIHRPYGTNDFYAFVFPRIITNPKRLPGAIAQVLPALVTGKPLCKAIVGPSIPQTLIPDAFANRRSWTYTRGARSLKVSKPVMSMHGYSGDSTVKPASPSPGRTSWGVRLLQSLVWKPRR